MMPRARIRLRVRAAWHELSCLECRVSWRAWARQLLGVKPAWMKQKVADKGADDA